MELSPLRLFGSYEFFGKSIPGAVAMLGIISLFPASDTSVVLSADIVSFAALLIILVLTGLMIGEGVHTVAHNIEKLFIWIARRFKSVFSLLRVVLNRDVNLKSLKSNRNIDQLPPFERALFGGWNGVIEWARRRYWGIYDSLVSHRRLLGKGIEWNFYPASETARWIEGDRGKMYDEFATEYERAFSHDIRKLDPCEIGTQYPMITGYLESKGITSFRHFQAIYSFCRSMWVLLLIFTLIFFDLVYTHIVFNSMIVTEISIVELLLSNSSERILPILCGIGAITFFDAAGTYKRHYIEYLIAEFVATSKS
jgi:hypothetical protein